MRLSEEKLQSENQIFLTVANSITGGEGYTLSLGRIGVDNRNACHMKMLPRDAVEAPSLELEDSAKVVADSI